MQISVREAARLLNVSEKTIYRWIRSRRIPAYQIGDLYRFNRAELLEWATAQRIEVSAEIVAEPDDLGPMPRLGEALRAGGVNYRVGGSSRDEVLRSAADIMRLPEEVDRDFLHEVLVAREDLGSTGLGDGIAVPHPRSPIVLHITRPNVMLCFLETAVDFGAVDGKPVDTLFTLVTPTVRSHLHLLSRLAFVLQNAPVREVLRERASRERIIEVIEASDGALSAARGDPE